MQRWTALAFALLLIAFAAGVVLSRGERNPVAPAEGSAESPAKDAGGYDATTPTEGGVGDGGETANAGTRDEGMGAADSLAGTTDAGGTLLNGSAPPALAADVPKSVVFGVILVQYKGAQAAPPNARSRDAALELAKHLAVEARQDFKAAVLKGDKGSMDNLGRMPRGVLEPAPEYALFSLPKDGVSDPVDTPRGFWIVHRIE
jgi:hypothetical protein